MLSFLPPTLKALLSTVLFILNTIFWTILFYPLIILKIVLPDSARKTLNRGMIWLAENWLSGNSLNMKLTQKIHWDIQGYENLSPKKSYLIFANHQTWMDIVVLQESLNRRVPFVRFFLKQQLLYVPLLGGAWWALDFPFMKRYSLKYLKKYPQRRSDDRESTRKACRQFRKAAPVSLLNFLEGTRWTAEKKAQQKPPYENLLSPKMGGVGYVLETMGDVFHSVLDVTIFYPHGAPSLWQTFSGAMPRVVIRFKEYPIPPELLHSDPSQSGFRDKLQLWIKEIWQEKDALLAQLHSENA